MNFERVSTLHVPEHENKTVEEISDEAQELRLEKLRNGEMELSPEQINKLEAMQKDLRDQIGESRAGIRNNMQEITDSTGTGFLVGLGGSAGLAALSLAAGAALEAAGAHGAGKALESVGAVAFFASPLVGLTAEIGKSVVLTLDNLFQKAKISVDKKVLGELSESIGAVQEGVQSA